MNTKESKVAPYLQNRELSWLAFNKRVLDQGSDPTVPLLERLNFISIFQSNLQEFFMVRVGSLTDLSLLKKPLRDSKTNMSPAEQLDAIYARCHELSADYAHAFEDVRSQLAKAGLSHLRLSELTTTQLAFLDDYLEANVLPYLSPQIVNSRHPFPHLANGALYVAVRLGESTWNDPEADPASAPASAEKAKDGSKGKKSKKAKEGGAKDASLGLIPLPRQCKRVVNVPSEQGTSFVLLEEALEHAAESVFQMYEVKSTNIICVTRNADLDTAEGTDESDDDYREHMKRILRKRARLAPVRLESARPLSKFLERFLLERLALKKHQVFVTPVPLDMSFTWGLPSLLPLKERAALTNEPFSPIWPKRLKRGKSLIKQVGKGEVLLSYPYESMDPFVELLREAALDPDVLSIRITLYRLASTSRLAEALIMAAENGKEVTALFELRARFDESNNIEWSQRFEEAGCKVIYGFHDLKVHSKICSIVRQTKQGIQFITQLGTGNYNEKTARLYTDFSFITTDPSFGMDAVDFFRNMDLEHISSSYKTLWVAPLQIKQNIMAGIDEQIDRARSGLPCGLFFKTNSVTDTQLIHKLVEASQAGVPTTLLVRGICCLVPGIPGYTENIRVVSIVGRLLEHSRIYCFGARRSEELRIYGSSADLMTRNMDNRIEIAWPIKDPKIRERIEDYLLACLKDTAKLRELQPDGSYTPLRAFADDGDRGPAFDSQSYLIELARKEADDQEREALILRAGRKDVEVEAPEVAAAANPEAAVTAEPETQTTPEVAAEAKPEPAPEPDAVEDPVELTAELAPTQPVQPSQPTIFVVQTAKESLFTRLLRKLRRKKK